MIVLPLYGPDIVEIICDISLCPQMGGLHSAKGFHDRFASSISCVHGHLNIMLGQHFHSSLTPWRRESGDYICVADMERQP